MGDFHSNDLFQKSKKINKRKYFVKIALGYLSGVQNYNKFFIFVYPLKWISNQIYPN